jgi:hypothetical protein
VTHRLYAYAADSDLTEVELLLVAEFKRFERLWGLDSVRLRNTKASLASGQDRELPDWNIGLSVETDQLTLPQVEQLIVFLKSIAEKSEHEFVVGTWSPRTSATEDLCFVNSSTSQEAAVSLLEKLRVHPWSSQAPR